MHIPVLLQEVVQILGLKNGDFVIDGTIDGGGHAAAMLKNIGPKGNLLGVDLDAAMITRATARFSRDKNVALVAGNYADLPKILESRRMERAHALLLDLGFSSEQLAHSGRGFSFSADEPLLMTYDDGQTPVRDILRQAGEKQLADIIFTLGGERLSRRIAQAIKNQFRTDQNNGDFRCVMNGSDFIQGVVAQLVGLVDNDQPVGSLQAVYDF